MSDFKFEIGQKVRLTQSFLPNSKGITLHFLSENGWLEELVKIVYVSTDFSVGGCVLPSGEQIWIQENNINKGL